MLECLPNMFLGSIPSTSEKGDKSVSEHKAHAFPTLGTEQPFQVKVLAFSTSLCLPTVACKGPDTG